MYTSPNAGDIENTDLSIPYNEIGKKISLPKDEKIVLYCRSGSMSKAAAKKLVELGYTNVYNLENGMIEWQQAGNQLVNKEKMMSGMDGEKLPFQQKYDTLQAAYVAMGPSNTIKVVDIGSLEVVDILPAADNPHGIAVTPSAKYTFTTSTKMGPNEMIMEPDQNDGEMDMAMMMKMGSDEIVVTDITTGKIIKKINISGGSHHMAITPDGNTVIVVVPSKSGIALIDAEKLKKSWFIETGKVPNYPAVSHDGKIVYVTNKGEDTVAVVDLNQQKAIKTIPVGVRPDHIAVSPDDAWVYVGNSGSDDVSIINSETLEVSKTVKVGESPHGISLTQDGQKLYVANTEDMSVTVLNTATNTLVKTIVIGSEVAHLEVTPNSRFVFVNSEQDGKVTVINTENDEIASTIEIGAEPHQVAFPT